MASEVVSLADDVACPIDHFNTYTLCRDPLENFYILSICTQCYDWHSPYSSSWSHTNGLNTGLSRVF